VGEEVEDAAAGRGGPAVVERLQVLDRHALALLVGHRLRRERHGILRARRDPRGRLTWGGAQRTPPPAGPGGAQHRGPPTPQHPARARGQRHPQTHPEPPGGGEEEPMPGGPLMITQNRTLMIAVSAVVIVGLIFVMVLLAIVWI